jgi:hypothetical protein
MFFIDEKPLDILLHEHTPKKRLIGWVPAISHADDPKDRDFAQTSIFPDCVEKVISPILICPDDLDFYCATVVVEVEVDNNYVTWHRVGVIKQDSDRNPPFISYKICISRLILEASSWDD